VRITVAELAGLWRGAAYSMRGLDQAPVAGYEPDAVSVAKAEQLEACAADLLNTQLHHDLTDDEGRAL
jgi:hypothetical protein